jgi:hypothetical protein
VTPGDAGKGTRSSWKPPISTTRRGGTWLPRYAQRTIERFTIADAETINYEITIEDPKVLTEPFTGMSTTFKRSKAGDELLEEECLEGVRLENYGFK